MVEPPQGPAHCGGRRSGCTRAAVACPGSPEIRTTVPGRRREGPRRSEPAPAFPATRGGRIRQRRGELLPHDLLPGTGETRVQGSARELARLVPRARGRSGRPGTPELRTGLV